MTQYCISFLAGNNEKFYVIVSASNSSDARKEFETNMVNHPLARYGKLKIISIHKKR